MKDNPLLWLILLLATPALGQTYLMNSTPIASRGGLFFDGGGWLEPYLNKQNSTTAICPDGGAGWAAAVSYTPPCTLVANLVSSSPATCPDNNTGSATIGVSGAMGAPQFFVDNNPVPFASGNLPNMFAAGNHQVIVADTAGCRDTVSFTIAAPPAITVSITVTDAECFGDNSGRLESSATGGSPPMTYAWQGCLGGPVIPSPLAIDLFAGCYQVTVTDSKGCTTVSQTTVAEPEMFQFLTAQDSVSCFGGLDGGATVFVSGAIPPYTFIWDNGDTAPSADSLKAGFHSVTITDKVGCMAVTLVQILQPPRLFLDSLVSFPLLCFGANTGSIQAFAHGGSGLLDYRWNAMQTGQIISNLGPGSYTVTVTDANGCSVSTGTQVVAPPDLVVQIAALKEESCKGACDGAITLAVSGGAGSYNLVWDNPSIPPGTANPQNLCPGTYRVTVTDKNGCTRSTVAVIPAATTLAIQLSGIPPQCAGDMNGSLSAAVMGGKTPYQYQWSSGDTGNTAQNLPCGVFTISVTDASNCTLTASDTLPCPNPIVVDSIISKPVRCFGEINGSVTVYALGGTGMLAYSWNDPNQQFDPAAVNLAPAAYTVTISDANNCSASASATVTEPPPMNAMTIPGHITCFGGNDGAVSTSVSGGVPPYVYAWNIPQTSPQITGLVAGTYSLTITDAYNCPFVVLPVTIIQPVSGVQVVATQTQLACFGNDNGAATAVASGSNGPPFTYAWSNGQNGPSPSVFNSGNFTVTATDAKGCTGTQTLTITQWDSIRVNVAFVLPTCTGFQNGQAAVNLVNGGAGNGIIDNYIFHWSVPGAADTIYINGLAGNQNYSLTVTDQTGCSETFSYFLNDPSPIVLTLRTDSVRCAGLADGAARISNIQSPRPVTQFQWNNGNTGQTITNLSAGVYTVVGTDAQGCSASASAVVYEPAPMQLDFDIQSLVCNNDSIGAIRAIAQGGTPGYTYAWNTGEAVSKIVNLGPGIFTITVTDKNGCTTERSTELSQPNSPDILAEVLAPSCHSGSDGLVRLTVTGGIIPYRFSLDGENYSGSSVFLGLAAGAYTVFVRDGAGCVTSQPVTLIDPPPLALLVSPDITITLGDSVLLSANAANAVGIPLYTWQSALTDTLICSGASPGCPTIFVIPYYSNVYFVTATDENGCQAAASVRVEVDKPRGVFVPSGFSPNSDGNNELLVVHGKGSQIRQVKMFKVFDRWGELVYEDTNFEVNDQQRGWNGTFRGQDCQGGVYVWYVEVEYLDGFTRVLRGDTTLIR